MGPWPHYQLNVWPELDLTVEPVTRPASASPSVGTVKRHVEEQKTLLDAAFASPRGRRHRLLSREEQRVYFTDRGHRGAREAPG